MCPALFCSTTQINILPQYKVTIHKVLMLKLSCHLADALGSCPKRDTCARSLKHSSIDGPQICPVIYLDDEQYAESVGARAVQGTKIVAMHDPLRGTERINER